jgi:hypothetical protein
MFFNYLLKIMQEIFLKKWLPTESKYSNIIGHASHTKGSMHIGGIGKGKET